MKIYYKIPDRMSDVEAEVREMYENSPDEYKPVGKKIGDIINELYTERLFFFFELIKYKLKWAVRGLEDEIEKENGMIVINDSGGADVEGFSDSLTDKIVDAINQRFEK